MSWTSDFAARGGALGGNPMIQGRYELMLATRGGYSSPQAWVDAGNRQRLQQRAALSGQSYVDYLYEYFHGSGTAEALGEEHRQRKKKRKRRGGNVGEAIGSLAGSALKGALYEATPDVDVAWYAKLGAGTIAVIAVAGLGGVYLYTTRKK